MSVSKRKGSPYYWYSFTIKGIRFRGSTEAEDHETAKDIEAQKRAEALSVLKIKKASVTVNYVMGKYWNEHGQHLKNHYKVWIYLEALTDFFTPGRPFESIDDSDVSTFKAHIRGRKKWGRKSQDIISNTTVNRYLTALRGCYYMAKDTWKYNVGEIDFKRHLMKEPKERTRFLTLEEANKLIDCSAEHLKPVIRFALNTGFRMSNILQLKWENINLMTREITVHIKSKLREGKEHTIPLTDELVYLLSLQGTATTGYIYKYQDRSFKNCRTAFGKAKELAGITNFTFHDLRHTSATWMLQAGVPIDVVQKILGHADIRTTLKYAHRVNSDKIDALQKLGSKTQLWRNRTPEMKEAA